MAQNIEIKYGSITIGTSSSSMYIGNFSETHSYRRYSITVDILVTGTSDSNFVTNIAAIEAELEKDNQTLTVKFGPSGSQTTHRNFVPSNFTGLNVRTTLNKRGDELDTDRSRVYTWTCEMDLPADSSDDNYRREASWTLAFDSSSRMTLSFSGTFTAGYPSNTATKAVGNYLDGTNGVDAWVATVFTDLDTLYSSITIQSSDFELTDERVIQRDDDHHLMDFSRTYVQRLYPDTSSGNNASIIGATVTFTRSTNNAHGNKQKGPVRVSVSYSCSVDAETTTYTGLAALWTGSIKPWLVAQAKLRWSGTVSAIESENTDIDVTGNGIRSNFTVIIYKGDNSIDSEDVTVSIKENPRNTYIDRWDGNAYSYNKVSPGADYTATVRSTVKAYNGIAPRPSVGVLPAIQGGGWDLEGSNYSYREDNIGVDHDAAGGSVSIKRTTTTWDVNWKLVREARFVQMLGVASSGRIITGSGTIDPATGKVKA